MRKVVILVIPIVTIDSVEQSKYTKGNESPSKDRIITHCN